MTPRWRYAAALALCCLLAIPALATETDLEGDYVGTLGPLQLELHLVRAADGTLSGTLDSPSQGATGIPCSDVRVDGNRLGFRVPSVSGSWTGTIEDDGALAGTWTQGSASPLRFVRDTFVPATEPSAVDGYWLGTLEPPGIQLRIQIRVRSDATGKQYCTLDSLDQRTSGLECANVVFSGKEFSFEVPVANAKWSGTLTESVNALRGTWSQGEPLPLDLERRASPEAPLPPKRPAHAPAAAPVPAAEMQATLGSDLKRALESGSLAPNSGAGVAIGVVRDGERRVFAFGNVRPDSVFEIGSITKTFTGLALAQLIAQGKVKAEQPVRELLPEGSVAKPEGLEISLLDLVTQHSGLPRLPDDMKPADPANPYADYDEAKLYRFIARRGVQRSPEPGYLYSNLGFGLLGQALANRAGVDYARLVKELVTDPLCMNDTFVTPSAEQRARLAPGRRFNGVPVPSWDLGSLGGAGALRSTAGDMLTYLEAQLEPDRSCGPADSRPPAARTLAAALRRTHELQAPGPPGLRIAYAWVHDPKSGIYWHDGATGGYGSFAFFHPEKRYAAIVLANVSVGPEGNLADRIGRHIEQRFAGKPAIQLD